jgi:hypothetical protein
MLHERQEYKPVNHSQAVRGRSILGKIGALVCILLFVALLDSCVSRFREPLFTVKLLPGQSEPVDGQLDPAVKDLSQLRVESPSPHASLVIKELRTGFWFGGNMWIGEITAAQDAPPGSYDIRVYSHVDKPGAPGAAFKALVFTDREAIRQSSLSFIERAFNVRPWIVSLSCVPILAVIFGMVYLFSTRIEVLLAREGCAEIFQLQKTDDGTEVWFGLGLNHGIAEGSEVSVCDPDGREIGRGIVKRVDKENAIAQTSIREDVLRGAFVRTIKQPAQTFRG